MDRGNSIIGELKGKIELLINEILPRIEEKIVKIEEGLENHLKRHSKCDEKKGDRYFKVATLVLQVILSAMVSYHLMKK